MVEWERQHKTMGVSFSFRVRNEMRRRAINAPMRMSKFSFTIQPVSGGGGHPRMLESCVRQPIPRRDPSLTSDVVPCWPIIWTPKILLFCQFFGIRLCKQCFIVSDQLDSPRRQAARHRHFLYGYSEYPIRKNFSDIEESFSSQFSLKAIILSPASWLLQCGQKWLMCSSAPPLS